MTEAGSIVGTAQVPLDRAGTRGRRRGSRGPISTRLGIVLYELVRESSFKGDTPVEDRMKHLSQDAVAAVGRFAPSAERAHSRRNAQRAPRSGRAVSERGGR